MSNAGTALVFPGMGPQRHPATEKFLLLNPIARAMVQEASDAVGYDLLDLRRDPGADYAESAQVLFLVTCLALARWAGSVLGVRAAVCAGPSFGAKAAAVHAGALDFPAAVWLTAEIARRETAYFAREEPGIVTHSFARTPRERLDEILAELADLAEWYEISCHVDEDFHMVSLRAERLDWLQRRIRAAGGLPIYTTEPPMHAARFAPLRDRVAAELFGELRFSDPHTPVVADFDGSSRSTADGIRSMLLDGFVRTVDWPRVVGSLHGLGVREICVAGPDALFGRVPCTTRNFEVRAYDPATALRPRPRVAGS